jgi:YidC/Oxa1 family membrane protein insertase
MDKKTLIVVVACLALLFGWQALVNKLFPPKPKPPGVEVAGVGTNALPATATTDAAAEAISPLPKPEALPPSPRPEEQIAVLSNSFVRVEFTSWGGGVRLVEMLRHRNNGQGPVVLNGTNQAPALVLRGLPEAGADGAFSVAQPDAQTVVLRTRTRGGLDVTKRFVLGDDYVVTGQVDVVGMAAAVATQALEFVVGTAGPVNAREPLEMLYVGWLAGEKFQYRELKKVAKLAEKGQRGEPVGAGWVSVKNQFFTMLLTPATNVTGVAYETTAWPAFADGKAKTPPQGLMATAQLWPTGGVGVATQSYSFVWYAGPKEYERLAALGGGQEEVMQFGFWGVISVVLLKSMKFFHNVIPNWGIAIILVTIVIKILFWPIQAKSIKSMKAMQQFQPLMQKLREKYKDDPQRLNAEMMKLYKEHKINPFSGCLPMLVQIPVFFALFTMLRSAVELRGARFLWIKDLSQPDTVLQLAGFPLNPLPLLMGVSMIWQMKLTPQTGDAQQQKIMQFMPLIFLFVCYNMSSGLVLYWTVQQLLSIAQQWWSLRQTGASAPVAAGKP